MARQQLGDLRAGLADPKQTADPEQTADAPLVATDIKQRFRKKFGSGGGYHIIVSYSPIRSD